MTPERKTVAQARLRLDEAVYRIRVMSDETGYYAKWTCTLCGQSGQSTVALPGQAAAFGWAEGAADVHHAMIHAGEL